jgi:hypothetical protein
MRSAGLNSPILVSGSILIGMISLAYNVIFVITENPLGTRGLIEALLIMQLKLS